MFKGVGIIIVNDKGEVLMQHRDNKPGIVYANFWSYIGGAVEKGENSETAARRELIEETGYIPDKLHKFKDKMLLSQKGEKGKYRFYWTSYDNKQEIKCFEGQEMKFVDPNNLGTKKLVPGIEYFFKLALKKAKLVGEVTS